MIARLWRGWTAPAAADAYEQFVRTVVLSELQAHAGYLGGYVLRRDGPDEVEFQTLFLFVSDDAVHSFAGPEADVARVPSEARALLSHYDETVTHYLVRVGDGLGATASPL